MEITCPRCGHPLHVADAAIYNWQSAPLLCDGCSQGYWLSELTPLAQQLINISNRTFPVSVRGTVVGERLAAQLLGHGITAEVKALCSPRQIQLFDQVWGV